MESLEARAKTVEEAIQQAINQLGVSREEVEVDVVSEGKSGILGLGGDEAVVRVTPITPTSNEDMTEYVQKTINELLGFLEVNGSAVLQPPPVVEGEEPTESMSFNIEGEDLGILIGRRGQTLSCLQYIVRLVVGHQKKNWIPIIIDVVGLNNLVYLYFFNPR